MKAEIKGYLLDTNNCIYYSLMLRTPILVTIDFSPERG